MRIAPAQYPLNRSATLDGLKEKRARWVAAAAAGGAELPEFPEHGAKEYAGVASDAAATLAAGRAARVRLHPFS